MSVAVLGGNVAGWTCAAYLALAGCPVELFDRRDRIPAELEAAQGELEAVLSLGFRFRGGQQLDQVDVTQYDAVYLASDAWTGQADGPAHAHMENGRLFTAVANADSLPPAEAVAEGRHAAFAIYAYLGEQI